MMTDDVFSGDEAVLGSGNDGDCSNCGIWINDVDGWYCDSCDEVTCEHCGKIEEENKLFLCPSCFLA